MNFKISLKLLALGTTTAKLSSHTSAFMPSSSSKIRASAIKTASTTRMKASRKPAPISATGGNIKISSLTVPQLKAVLSEQGLPVSGDKNELVSRLSDLALQKKQEQVSKLSSMAMEQKQRKKSSKVDSTPPPSIKKQVAEAVESHKKKAKARANSTNKNTNDGNVLTTKQKKRKKPSKVNLVTPPSINNQVADREDSHEELEIEVENTNVSNNNGFSKIDVPDYLVARLNEMGIFEPTPIQTKAIPLAIRGKDVMGLAQTGTGKTLAFGLPLVAQMMEAKNGNNKRSAPKGVQGLVLAPTRELATQIAVQLGILTQGSPIRTFVVVGGQNINAQINKLKDGTEILVATPGRLIDLMDRRAVSLKGTTFLVLDEADLMLDMGFLPSLKKISSMLPKKRQTMLFSATMSKNMNVVASSYLKDPVRVEVAKAGVTADKVSQEIHFIAKANKAEKLLELLQNPDHKEDRSIVFGRTKHGMEKLSKKLLKAGIKAGSIHGECITFDCSIRCDGRRNDHLIHPYIFIIIFLSTSR
jgi:ATP-dependent helicase YprA (DUF1998 family)